MKSFETSKDKILMGMERNSLVISEQERIITAYHESGHAIVGLLVPDHDPVYKISITPRSKALGVTLFLPEQDRFNQNKVQLESQLASLFGGRAAEELIFGKDKITIGASNDIERATEITRNMVTKWGLSEKIGPITINPENDGNGKKGQDHNISEQTAIMVDEEIRYIMNKNYKLALNILMNNMDKLHAMVEALLIYETIDTKQIKNIMSY
jgi:cell division protease FtsH